MIDYEKLKIAHEYAEKLSKITECSTHIKIIHFTHFNPVFILIDSSKDMDELEFNNLDDLITKLQELTKPEPKYELGNRVWYQYHGKPFGANIVFVGNEEYEIDDSKNNNGKTWFTETELYPTKQALIEAQIEYWSSQLDTRCVLSPDIKINQHEVDIDRCQHESSRILRLSDGGDGLCHYDVKCKKCGEFYK